MLGWMGKPGRNLLIGNDLSLLDLPANSVHYSPKKIGTTFTLVNLISIIITFGMFQLIACGLNSLKH